MNNRFPKILLVFLLVLIGLFLIYPSVSAAEKCPKGGGLVPCGRLCDDPTTPEDETRNCTTCDIFALASRVINFVLFTLVPVIAVLFYLWAGLMVLLGGANPGLVKTGYGIFRTTTYGLLIIFGAWMLTNTVLKSLAGDSDYSKTWFTIKCTTTVQQQTPTQRFTCSSLGCIPKAGGEYTESTCGGKCVAAQNKYSCKDGRCILDYTGPYTSSDCDNECVVAEGLVFKTVNLPGAIVDQNYDQAIIVQGGQAPYTFSIVGGSLQGVFNLSSDGKITGKPPAAGNAVFTVKVEDSSEPKLSATREFSIKVVYSGAVSIATASLADALVNTRYNATITASGGKTPYTFSIISGALPPGMLMAGNGTITGTPATAGDYTFTVKVEDSSTPTKQSATKQLSIKVAPVSAALTISNVAASNITATNATITWTTDKPSTSQVEYGTSSSFGSVTTLDSTLKTSHSVNPTGLTPNTTYYYRAKSSITGFTAVSSTNTFKTTATAVTLLIITSSLPDGTVNQNYSQTLQASGGKSPYTWSKTVGDLPPGVTLAASGTISGKPTTAGTYTFTVKVEDSSTPTKQSATKQLSIKINPVVAAATCPFSGVNLCQGVAPPGGCSNAKCSQYVDSIKKYASGAATVNLLKALMFIESSCNVGATTGSSYGLMQLMPETANKYRQYCGVQVEITSSWLTNPANADRSICIAAQYVNRIAESKCGSSPRNIYAGYNGGTGVRGACDSSNDCAGEKSCSGEAVKMWECLYDIVGGQKVCNGDNCIFDPADPKKCGYNQTKQGATYMNYCVNNPSF